jgi:cyclase
MTLLDRFENTLPALALLALAAGVISGQAPTEAQKKGVRDMTQKTEQVKPGLFFISGAGGNSLLRVTNEGLILMDGKLPGNYDPLMEQVRKISNLPIKYLITTHHHEDHTGNNAKFLEAGVQIIGQENLKKNLATYNPPGGKVAPPTTTYDKDYTLRLGGVAVELHHYGNAHTSGDTVVYFPDLKVVAVSDVVTPGSPNADFAGGGSIVGWGPVLAEILKLDFDVAVPGTGPMLTKADVQAFKTKIDTLTSRATELVRKGTPKDQLMTELKTDDLGWKLNYSGDRLDRFYAELSAAK